MSGGGLFASQQIPSHRFNPAEKGMFWWGICVPGIFVVGSGLVLDKLLPGLGYLRGDLLTVLSPQRMVRAYRVDPATLESIEHVLQQRRPLQPQNGQPPHGVMQP